MERKPGVFQFSLLALICLTSISLSIAEGEGEGWMLLHLGTIPIAFLSLIFIDQQEQFYLSPIKAAILGIAAMNAAGYEFYLSLTGVTTIEGRILAVAHVITYFQWIFLLQKKNVAIYWWLFALCQLQMAVSAVLTYNAWFGLSLLLFMFIGIWTLANFSVYRARLRVGKIGGGAKSASFESDPPKSHKRKSGRTNGNAGVVSQFLKTTPSKVRGSVHIVPGESWINSRFVLGTLILTCISVFIGFFFYVGTPRLQLGKVQVLGDPSEAVTKLSGFSDTVKLGEMGEILENDDPVLTVRFQGSESDKPLNVETVFQEYGYVEPMFRGTSKEIYEESSWKAYEPDSFFGKKQMRYVPVQGRFNIRQDYTIEDIGTQILFSLPPVLGGVIENGQSRTMITLASDTISSPDNYSGRVDEYTLLTARPVPAKQGHPVIPILYRDVADYYSRYRVLEKLLELPEGLDRLAEFARGLVQAEEKRLKRELSMPEKAFLLESHLRDSGDYGYTLSQEIKDDKIDPVVDFLFNRKEGHCQYYAATLALMLRAVEIPSRYINGFKGGKWDEKKKEFKVTQRHAHAWVEAFDSTVPGWIVLDATPAGRNESIQINDEQDPVRAAFGFAKSFWSETIMGINKDSQQKQIYMPLYRKIVETWNQTQSTRMVLYSIWEFTTDVLSTPEKLFSLQGLTLIAILGMFLGLLAWLLPIVYSRIVKSGSRLLFTSSSNQRVRIVEFYEQFLRLLNQHHYQRDQNATPREFARSLEITLQEPLEQAELEHFPSQITEAYYSIRYGDRRIPESTVQKFGENLAALGETLNRATSNGNRT